MAKKQKPKYKITKNLKTFFNLDAPPHSSTAENSTRTNHALSAIPTTIYPHQEPPV